MWPHTILRNDDVSVCVRLYVLGQCVYDVVLYHILKGVYLLVKSSCCHGQEYASKVLLPRPGLCL